MSVSDIRILVGLLDDWHNLLLKGNQRGMFFIWLSDHAKTEIHPETFREKLIPYLLGMADAKALYTEVLTIHTEILWAFHRTQP
jgi:hypothetical protein